MADKAISALTAAGALTGSEIVPIVQSGNTRRTTALAIADLASGDVVGPALASDNAVARFDTTTGKLIQNSAAAIDDNGALTIPNHTITTSVPVLNLAQTWNAGATTFTAIKMNVTDTASAAASLLMDLQVGGASKFNVRKDGQVFAATSVKSLFGDFDNVSTGSDGYFGFGGSRGYIKAPADGVFIISNAAETDFGRIQFGGATSAFPALKRSAAEVHARLADDSADTVVQVSALKVSGNQVVGARVVDARIDDVINSGDATTDGVIDAIRDAMIAHGLMAAA